MTSRVPVLAVLLAAAAPGLLFAPVFGIGALALPLALVVAAGFAVSQLCGRRPALVPWRPVLVLVAGLLALSWAMLFPTTVAGLPTAETVRALVAGVADSWQLTLQSTWPARSDPELMLFVPLAALAAAVLGLELLRWPLLALLPGIAVVVLAQAYVALTGPAAVLAAFGFAVVAGLLLSTSDGRGDAVPTASRRGFVAFALVVPTVVLAVAGAVLATTVHPVDRPAVSLRDKQFVPLPPDRVASPLDELSDRLQNGGETVFTYSADDPVDRWRMVVLDRFNGVGWTPSAQPRRMGTELRPVLSVPRTEHSARVRYPRTESPWLPSQALPVSVTGLAPLVDETSGTLLDYDRTGPAVYDLTWLEPRPDPADLRDAAIDPNARTGLGDLGEVPAGIADLAREAVGDDRPAFQTALVLERFFRGNYRLASGGDLPSGSGWPQLRTFLLDTEVGTTEQFAAAYVVLARIVGIPARIAVGFRAPEETGRDVAVHNSDVLAWPEVAVAGVGWVPLDPAGATTGEGVNPKGLAEATAAAREQLPPPEDVRDPELPDDDTRNDGASDADGAPFPWLWLLTGVAAVVVAWTAGVPLARAIRAWRRRRRPGAAAVVGAWAEARDRLRAHDVPYTAGMTARDLATATNDPLVAPGLHSLARAVDVALWSKAGPAPATAAEAWAAVRAVRAGLAKRPFAARVKAALDPRSLVPPR
ncbi:transglutaminaseTgpA domain-containing protein [Actinophytocola glycyrrhizae]|uniref:TransglutaminaseTgpA domain-containing protein n=1 Tax=Actinophytocola glycyrrhizae TaxID=2044873 RepID=A0ABV9SBV4_9PSEU